MIPEGQGMLIGGSCILPLIRIVERSLVMEVIDLTIALKFRIDRFLSDRIYTETRIEIMAF